MWRKTTKNFPAQGLSLVEVLVVIAVIGILAAVAIPTVTNINESSKKATAIRNAQNAAKISASLEAFGVAHVIPESLGGVEATVRLIREGVTVPAGSPMAGEVFGLPGLSDESIAEMSAHLEIRYGLKDLRLIYKEESDETTGVSLYDFALMLCAIFR